MVTVPNDRIGKVIGPGGSGLRHLWRLARVKANVPREPLENGDRQIQLTGTPEQVQQAQHILLQIIAQQGPPVGAAGASVGSVGLPPLLPPAHPQMGPAPVGSFRLLLEPGRAGHLVGKAGSGLREIREESGAQFELARGDWLGGRLITIRPPVASQLRCIHLLCRKLGSAVDGSPCPVHVRVLLSSDVVGSVVGRSGAGLRALRETGIALELPREEVVPGWRLLSLSGPGPSITVAVSSVCAKLAEACGMAPGMQPALGGGFLPPPKPHHGMLPGGLPQPQQHGLPPLAVALTSDGRPLQPLLDPSGQLGMSLAQQQHAMLQQMQHGQLAGMSPHHFYAGPAHGGPGCMGLQMAAATDGRWLGGRHGDGNEITEPADDRRAVTADVSAASGAGAPGAIAPGAAASSAPISELISTPEMTERRPGEAGHVAGDPLAASRASADGSSRDSGVSHGGRDSAVSTVSHPRISTSWA